MLPVLTFPVPLKVVLSDFRSLTFVQDVAHVINYDMPGDIEMYTHRIGMLKVQMRFSLSFGGH
jgi:hypothetical protein